MAKITISKGYTKIPPSIFVSGLSLKAIGLLCYLLAIGDGDDPETIYWLAYDSRENIDSSVSELQEKGFLAIKGDNWKVSDFEKEDLK